MDRKNDLGYKITPLLEIINSIIKYIALALFSIAIFFAVLHFYRKFNFVGEYVYKSDNIIDILTLNVGILQAFIAVMGISIAIIGFINIYNTKKEISSLKEIIRKHTKSIKKQKRMIKNFKNSFDNDKNKNSDIEKLVSETENLNEEQIKEATTNDFDKQWRD